MLPACFRLRVCNPRSLLLPALFPKNVRQQDAAPAGSHCSFTPYRFLITFPGRRPGHRRLRVANPQQRGCVYVGVFTWVCLRVGVFTCGCVYVWVCLRGCVYVWVFTCGCLRGCVCVWVFTWLQTRSNVALPLAHVLPYVLSHVLIYVLIHVLIHVQAGMLPACFRLRVCNPRSLLLPALFPKNVRQQDAAPAGSHCSFTPYRFLITFPGRRPGHRRLRVANPQQRGCVYVVANPQQRGCVCVWVFACGCLRGCVFVERGHCLF